MHSTVWKLSVMMVMASVFLFALAESAISQPPATRYAKAQLFMSNGMVIKGEDLIINPDSITVDVGGATTTYQLSEVRYITARKGLASRWAVCSGGGCTVICLIAAIVVAGSDNDISEGEIYTAMVYIGGSTTVGYLLGGFFDSWQPVYMATSKTSRSHPSYPMYGMSGQFRADGLEFGYGLRF